MKYFTIKELSRSETAEDRGIDNTMPEEAKKNAAALVDNVLDPLREAWGGPIDISSGYRCPALNKAVGGSRTSHHLRGMAADLRIYVRKNGRNGEYVLDRNGDKIVDVTANRQLFQLVIDLKLPYCQLIDEKGFSWVHISYDPKNVKRQVLRL